MENEEKKGKDKGKSRIPPRRGQIKEKIFANLLKQLKIAATAGGGRKREDENKSSASTTPPDQSSYCTSNANSDI